MNLACMWFQTVVRTTCLLSCHSWNMTTNLHLDQEWCPDLYWSLVLCNSPKKKTCVNNLSGQDMYHRVYFTESLAEKRDTGTSTTVRKNLHLDQEWCPDLNWSLVLCNSPKKYLVLLICLGKKRVYFTQSLEEKRDTGTSTTVRKNLHLDQEWCPDLNWSLVLCNSPKKKTCGNNLSGKDLYHRVYFTESLAEKRDTGTVINNSKEKLTFRSRVVS